MVKQYYEIQVYDIFVMNGNSAIFKCQIPSFVADHVDIVEWVNSANETFSLNSAFGMMVLNSFTSFIPILNIHTILYKKGHLFKVSVRSKVRSIPCPLSDFLKKNFEVFYEIFYFSVQLSNNFSKIKSWTFMSWKGTQLFSSVRQVLNSRKLRKKDSNLKLYQFFWKLDSTIRSWSCRSCRVGKLGKWKL